MNEPGNVELKLIYITSGKKKMEDGTSYWTWVISEERV